MYSLSRVCLKERKLRVRQRAWRKKGRGENKGVPMPRPLAVLGESLGGDGTAP